MDIQTKIDRTWDYCISMFGRERLIALTHHGSWNYNLALPNSDADAKLFIVPTWQDILYCHKPESRTIAGPFGDINVTDIRLFIDVNLRKQNFNFLECLFTPYSCVNPDYFDIWQILLDYREAIAHYNPHEAVRTMLGQAENQKRRWGKFDDEKTTYHMLRIEHAIREYLYGERFEDTLAPKGEDHDFIMLVRESSFDKRTLENIFNCAYDNIQEMIAENALPQEQGFVAGVAMEKALDKFMRRALEWRFKS
jgi:hypothetical protein